MRRPDGEPFEKCRTMGGALRPRELQQGPRRRLKRATPIGPGKPGHAIEDR